MPKNPTLWQANPTTGDKTYNDSTITYSSSSVLYSAISPANRLDTVKEPALWDRLTKPTNQWELPVSSDIPLYDSTTLYDNSGMYDGNPGTAKPLTQWELS